MKNKNEIAVIETKLSPLVSKSQSIVITAESLPEATNILSQLNKWNDQVEADKQKVTVPLNLALKEIRIKYKPVETMLAEAISSIRLKMGKYQSEALVARKEAEDALLARVAPGKGNLKLETAINKLAQVETPESRIVDDHGSVTFIEVEKFEVVDISLLPKEYLLANEVLIRASMKEGKRLEGVRYYKEQSVRNMR